MDKAIAEIMNEPANVDEIIRQAKAINKQIEDSKRAGTYWPELENTNTDDNEPTE